MVKEAGVHSTVAMVEVAVKDVDVEVDVAQYTRNFASRIWSASASPGSRSSMLGSSSPAIIASNSVSAFISLNSLFM